MLFGYARVSTADQNPDQMFDMLSVLAELQRELIVANTMDGLTAARARSRGPRPGRRPPTPSHRRSGRPGAGAVRRPRQDSSADR
jgi:DNA invertase Pin-like site-specific DNA recombinase